MRRVAVINQKGGVGKTTTAVNLGAALARRGRRVLLLDLDPQANLTLHVDRRPGAEHPTMAEVFLDDRPLRDLIQQTATPGLDVIPADTTLSSVEQMLANRIGREMVLREAFEKLEAGSDGYEIALLDCPPSLGVLSANALVASHEVLIPLQTEYFALQGMAKLMEVVTLVAKRLNTSLKISAILPCMVDLRTNLTSEVLAEISRHFGDKITRTMIRANVKLAEAPSFGRTIFEHAPESNGARDYETFAAEFLGELPADAVQFDWEQPESAPPSEPVPVPATEEPAFVLPRFSAPELPPPPPGAAADAD
jgi:chromosome partitioning protein